jgi:hypothetical protein
VCETSRRALFIGFAVCRGGTPGDYVDSPCVFCWHTRTN